MRILQSLLLLSLMVLLLAGCATSTVLSDGTRTKVFTPCTNNTVCLTENLYDIVWDRTCADYPISYRAKNYQYDSMRTEYIYRQTVFTER